MTLLVTACTRRKRIPPAVGLRARDLEAGAVGEVSREWQERIAAAAPAAQAWRLYCGRGFREAVLGARVVGTSPTIVSAGLGVVDGEDRIPSYGLTVAPGSIDDVTIRSDPRVSAGIWWGHLTRERQSLADRLRSETGLVVIALPRTYLTMVAEDLRALPGAVKSRLRIVSGSDVSGISEDIAEARMPYDARFDGADSPNPGTAADFASRAARHFIEVVLTARPGGSAEEHRDDVERQLAGSVAVGRRMRIRATDAEIAALLRLHWDAARGQTARLLRLLRDDLGMACEQGRLARLAALIRCEREPA